MKDSFQNIQVYYLHQYCLRILYVDMIQMVVGEMSKIIFPNLTDFRHVLANITHRMQCQFNFIIVLKMNREF
jgi:hypothetical protein